MVDAERRIPSSAEPGWTELNIVTGGFITCAACSARFTRVSDECPTCGRPLDRSSIRLERVGTGELLLTGSRLRGLRHLLHRTLSLAH
jgi:predicted amidophosphoribosyltransferase